MIVAADRLREQLAAVFRAWGMPEEQLPATVERMLESDLAGIDSHGIAMLPLYAQLRREGRLEMTPTVAVLRESPTGAVVDGGSGLGHYPATRAMELAIAKARASGIALVTVRNSNHYGAAGVYALLAAEAGLIGMSMTNVHLPAVVPTFAADPMFGTNPIAFAAPARRHLPYLLDMATSTVAIGKLKIAQMAGKSVPEGWALDADGAPVIDPAKAIKQRRLTPLGGTRQHGGHKGYGLAMMVEILSVCLGGGAFAPIHEQAQPQAKRYNVGHVQIAIDPARYREAGAFESDLDAMIDALHATRPVDPAQPVIVAGEPEHAARAHRLRHGIPLPAVLVEDVAAIAAASGAAFVLG